MVLNFNAAGELGCTVLVELSWWLVAHQALSAKIQCAAYYQQVLLCSGFLHFRNFIFTLKDDLCLTLCRSSVLSESDPAFDQYCYSSDFEQLCSSFQVIHFVQHRASKKYLGFLHECRVGRHNDIMTRHSTIMPTMTAHGGAQILW
jgi:hypothetical protein